MNIKYLLLLPLVTSFQITKHIIERKQNFRCYSCNEEFYKYPSTLYNTTDGKLFCLCNNCCSTNKAVYSWVDMNYTFKY